MPDDRDVFITLCKDTGPKASMRVAINNCLYRLVGHSSKCLKDQFTVITWDLPGHGQSKSFEDAAAYDRDRDPYDSVVVVLAS